MKKKIPTRKEYQDGLKKDKLNRETRRKMSKNYRQLVRTGAFK